MNFRTYEDLSIIISNNLYKIPSDVDLIVGVPRSGLMAASLISLYLNLPLTDIDSLLEGNIYKAGDTKKKDNWITKPEKARKILVVDDSSMSGNTINKIRGRLKGTKYEKNIVFLVIFVTEKSKKLPDMYFDVCEWPRMFEWNFMHHKGLLKNACVDIDGVLCQDPTEEENDDGPKYKKFITTVKPRVIPSAKIGWLVTTRLEKYRKETEYWLKKNHIEYDHLIMMNLKSKEERLKLGNHGKYKGEEYKKIEDALIFIESSVHQAPVIANVSGKPAFCVDNSKLYLPTEMPKQESKKREMFRKYIPLSVRKSAKSIKKLLKKDTRNELLWGKKRNKLLESYRKKLTNKDFTLITQNCIGGVIYDDLGMQFTSPTINMFIEDDSFVKLVENLEHYMSIKPKKVTDCYIDPIDNNIKYPVIKIDDIKINCLHSKDCNQAIEDWERRKKRINFNNIIVIANSWNLHENKKLIERIGKIKYKKIIFTYKDYNKEYCIPLKGDFWKKDERGIVRPNLTDFMPNNSIYRYFEKIFDFVEFINKKEK